MNCPRCESSDYHKDGIVQNRQRYRCKKCNYRYTVERKSDVKPPEMRRFALQLYLEGLGYRAIGRILNVSNVTVYKWIKAFGESVDLPKSEEPVEIVELDELHTYVAQKKTMSGYGLLLIDMETGSSILSVGTDQQKQD